MSIALMYVKIAAIFTGSLGISVIDPRILGWGRVYARPTQNPALFLGKAWKTIFIGVLQCLVEFEPGFHEI